MTATSDPTLHQALAAVGWRSEPAMTTGCWRVYDDAGQLVGVMSAGTTWAMLRERGLVLP